MAPHSAPLPLPVHPGAPIGDRRAPVLRVNVGHDGPDAALPPGVMWDSERRRVSLDTDLDVSLVVSGDGYANVTLSGFGSGHVARVGSGDGTAQRTGFGPGNAIRSGDGRGHAIRDLGAGNAVRTGAGTGDSINRSPAPGHAHRLGAGSGNAARTSGPGNAIRDGSGEGSARHVGPAGTAQRRGTGRGRGEVVETRHRSHGEPWHVRIPETDFGLSGESLGSPCARFARACVVAAIQPYEPGS